MSAKKAWLLYGSMMIAMGAGMAVAGCGKNAGLDQLLGFEADSTINNSGTIEAVVVTGSNNDGSIDHSDRSTEAK